MSRLLFLLAFGFVFVSCSLFGGSSGSDCGSGAVGSGTFTATAGSKSFQAICIQGQFSSGNLSVGGNLGATEGGAQRQINLTVAGAQAGQTYTFGLSTPGLVAVYSELSIRNPTDTSRLFTANAVAGSGSITVDGVSASGASGTFAFTGRNNDGQTLTVAGGRFEVEF